MGSQKRGTIKQVMSVYDHRDRPAYEGFDADPDHSENPYILKWWTEKHDHLLFREIKAQQWAWPWKITIEIVAISPPEAISTWKSEDPACSKYAWYNVLMYFAISRADRLGLTSAIRPPEWKRCPLCGEDFIEDSLPVPLIDRLGINQLDFCAPCLRDTVLQNNGNDAVSREEIMSYLRDLANVLKRIPPQGFGGGMHDLLDMSTEERLVVLRRLQQKPASRRVKELFGSWSKALIEAGLLEDGGSTQIHHRRRKRPPKPKSELALVRHREGYPER